MDLTDRQSAALQAICEAESAWPTWAELEAAHGHEALKDLVSIGLVTRWDAPDTPRAALTAIASHRTGLVLEERWQTEVQHEHERFGVRSLKRVRRKVEVPRWERGVQTEEGVEHQTRPVRLEGGTRLREKPVVIPRHNSAGIPDFPAPKPPKAVQKYVGDWETGELVSGEDGDPVPREAMLCGVPVEIDKRAQRHRAVDAMRRRMRA